MANSVGELVKRANQLAVECEKKKDYKQAVALYIKAINLDPKNTKSITSLCAIYFNNGQLGLAEKVLLGALKLSPENEFFNFQLGKLYGSQRKHKEAVHYLLTALKFNENFREIYLNLAHVYAEMHEYVTALDYANRGIKKFPDYAKLYNNIAFIMRAMGDIEGGLKYQELAKDKLPKDFRLFSNYLFYLASSPITSPEEFLQKAKEYCSRVSEGIQQYKDWPELYSKKKIRVGFVSGDFRNHPVTSFIENWLGLIDKDKFELVAYYNFTNNDHKTLSLHSLFSEWYPVASLSDEELAKKIHSDHIHILFDLSGHTAHNRLPMFAWKPAPIQISWIGIPGSTGMKQIDYVMPNIEQSPPQFDHHFTEKPWYLSSAGCLKPPEVKIEVNQLPALNNGYITFGSFHSVTKLTDQVLKAWSEIIKNTPKSKLFFKCKELTELKTQEQLLSKMDKLGVDVERIILAGASPLSEYFKAYHEVDIGLDPFPYSSGTMGYHSVWMGVPFVTLAGDRMLSRVGYSTIKLVGLDEFTAESVDEYIQAAIEAAMNTERLQEIRMTLREASLKSGLYDGQKMASELETAFMDMWQLFLNNNEN